MSNKTKNATKTANKNAVKNATKNATKTANKKTVESAIEFVDFAPTEKQFSEIMTKLENRAMYKKANDKVQKAFVAFAVNKIIAENKKAQSEKNATKTATKLSKSDLEKIEKSKILDYSVNSSTGAKIKNPQLVKEFGRDKHGRYSRFAFLMSSFFFLKKKLTKFNALDAKNFFKSLTGYDFQDHYSSYPDSPLHRGLHAISKSETKEVTDRDGKSLDTFARGARALILKDSFVGIKREDSFYHRNSETQYDKKVELVDLKILAKGLVEILPTNRR